MERAEVVVIGAGAAGLGLATRLAGQRQTGVVLVQSPQPAPPRTWCSWHRSPVAWADAVAHRWDDVQVHGPDGRALTLRLAPYRYEMVRSTDYERWAADRLDDVERVSAAVEVVEDGSEHAVVRGGGVEIAARWVLDTRPAAPARTGRTTLLQHFRGWTVRTGEDCFHPSVAGLMDFRVPQPSGGVAFGYVLPTSRRTALVEYTEFTRDVLDDAGYDAALRRYVSDVLGLRGFDVDDVEQGVIPMTDAAFPRQVGRRVFRLGAAGGATRPSTGYTFAAAQRQAAAVAEALRAGREPLPPPAYPRRHLAMDALLLHAIDTGRLQGAAFLADLFARHPVARVLRFLDGESTAAEELRVMASAPRAPMLRAAASLVGR